MMDVFFSRNAGFITIEEQSLLAATSVVIAGVGGDGGLLAERLVRMGIGKMILADPECFSVENTNRQFAANTATVGRNKALTVGKELLLINPYLILEVYTEGITCEHVKEIISQGDIIVDEVEYSMPAVSVMLHKEARAQGKHVFMGANIGWGASIFCFEPGGIIFEEWFDYNAAAETINPLKYLKDIPAYITDELRENVLGGTIPMPSLSSSVSLVASLLTNEIVFFITGKRAQLIVPRFLSVDLFDLTINKY